MTVYANLPASCLFLWAFSRLSDRYPRRLLFNMTLGAFAAFFAAFILVCARVNTRGSRADDIQ